MNIRIYYEQSKCNRRVFSIKRKVVRNLTDTIHSPSKINAFGLEYIEVIQLLCSKNLKSPIHMWITKLSQKDDNSINTIFWFSLFAQLLPEVMQQVSCTIRNPNFNSSIISSTLYILQSKVVYRKRIRKFLLHTKLFGKNNQQINPSNDSFSSKNSIYLTCSKSTSDGCLSFQIILCPSLPTFPIPVSCDQGFGGGQ